MKRKRKRKNPKYHYYLCLCIGMHCSKYIQQAFFTTEWQTLLYVMYMYISYYSHCVCVKLRTEFLSSNCHVVGPATHQTKLVPVTFGRRITFLFCKFASKQRYNTFSIFVLSSILPIHFLKKNMADH